MGVGIASLELGRELAQQLGPAAPGEVSRFTFRSGRVAMMVRTGSALQEAKKRPLYFVRVGYDYLERKGGRR